MNSVYRYFSGFALLPLLLFAVSCGDGKRVELNEGLSAGELRFGLLGGSCSQSLGIKGSCSIQAGESLGGVAGEKSFALRFRLDDGGSLTMHAFANGTSNGFDLQFRRNGSRLEVRAVVGGRETNYDANFSAYDASGSLAFQIDVHNSESPTHLLIWDAASAPSFTADRKLVNSECTSAGGTDAEHDCNNFGASGRGAGSNLAFSLTNALLQNVAISGPKFSD